MKLAAIIMAGIVLAVVLLVGTFVALTWAPERELAELQGRWALPPSVFLEVAGMRVHLRDEGPREDQSPIVLLHGSGASLHVWEGWAAALKHRRRVIRFDLPGFGLTGPSPNGLYGIDADMRLLIALLDRLGIERCVLGGNSLGGAVAWRTALVRPARVERLILVDAGGYPANPTAVPLGFRLMAIPGASWVLKYTLPRILVEEGLRSTFGDPGKVTPELVDRYVELTQREGNRDAFIARSRQRRPGTFADRIGELRVPTLIIWGGRDRLMSPDNARRFHADIPGSTLVVLDDLGHQPEEEDPARTVAAVKSFLDLE
ncbi:MAG TPA: alpha/beta hydrolase [Xanthobacteraceae bacterium]|jgi:pimeloyl-ACP methyl ester carboxylesterase